MVKVSVIVPVYNVEKYLPRCLDSLINQTMQNIEIILINDGSTDSSPIICQKYEKKYKNVKYVSQKNQGLSGARNTGIKHANGEYIGFVDSDDYVDKDMFEFLYNVSKKYDVDIASCGYEMFFDDGKIKKCGKQNFIHHYDRNEALDIYLLPGYFDLTTWNKLYKRELFNNVKFPIGVVFEDMPTIYKLIANSNGLYYDSDSKYHYYRRKGSLSSVVAEEDLNRQIEYVDEYLQLCKKILRPVKLAYLGRIRWLLVIFDKKLRGDIVDVELANSIRKMIGKKLFLTTFSRKLILKEKLKFWLFFVSPAAYTRVYRFMKMRGEGSSL